MDVAMLLTHLQKTKPKYKEKYVQKLRLVYQATNTVEDKTQKIVYWVSNTLPELYLIDKQ